MSKIFRSHQSIGDRSAPLNGTFRQKASQMVSDRLRVRLEQREAVLRLLDRRRAQTGDPNLGWGMEKKILDLELADSKNANEFSNSVRVLPAHGGNAFPERL